MSTFWVVTAVACVAFCLYGAWILWIGVIAPSLERRARGDY